MRFVELIWPNLERLSSPRPTPSSCLPMADWSLASVLDSFLSACRSRAGSLSSWPGRDRSAHTYLDNLSRVTAQTNYSAV